MKTLNPIYPTTILAIVLAGYSFTARSASLNDTTEVRCVTQEGAIKTNCAQSGQDAATGRDVTAPGNKNGLAGFKFQKVCKNGNTAGKGDCPADPLLGDTPTSWGCTKDQVTGILWEMKAESGDRNYRIWYNLKTDPSDDRPQANQHISDMNEQALCGRTDWRLPNNQEVQSIVAYGQGDGANKPTIDETYFPYSQINGLWTGTLPFRSESYYLDLQDGGITFGDFSYERPVRAISHTRKYPPERFVVWSHNELLDTATKLIWRRCAEGKLPNEDNCGKLSATSFTFFEAIAHAKTVAAETGVPWRVPNIKEIVSITDPTKTPAAKTKFFPGFGDVSLYHSSTPFIQSGKDSGKTWTMSPSNAVIGPGALPAALLLVRDWDEQ